MPRNGRVRSQMLTGAAAESRDGVDESPLATTPSSPESQGAERSETRGNATFPRATGAGVQGLEGAFQREKGAPSGTVQDKDRTGGPGSARQARFVEEYLIDGNATRSAVRAGYSSRTAKQQGSRLLAVPHVAAAIREGTERRAKRVEVKQDDVIRELKVIAFAEPGEKYRAGDKVKALDLLGKFLKMWAERPEDAKAVQIVIQKEGGAQTPQDAPAGPYGVPRGGAKA